MKKCPQCQRTFDDTMNFCQFDAVPLVAAGNEDNLPPTVVGFQLPPTQVSNQQFDKPTHPQMPAFQTQQNNPSYQSNQPNSQFQGHQNNQSYQPNQQFQTNQQSPNFNPQFNFPGAAAQTDQTGKRPGNRWAMAGLGFMIAACVLTVFALGLGGFRGFGSSLGFGSFEGLHMRFSVLPIITMLVTFIAFAFAALAFLLMITKPDKYGRRSSTITVLLVTILLFGVQLIVTGRAYSETSKYTSVNFNTNYGSNRTNSGSNTANYGTNSAINRPANTPNTPVPLQTSIVGTWRDNVGATATFYANRTLVINDRNGKKIADADYEISGTNKMTMIKNGKRVKEYTIIVSGNQMTMDGETMTKVY